MTVRQQKRIDALEKEVEDLKKFKTRIELGSFWFRCLLYTIGGIAAFIATAFSIVKDWPFK